MDISMSKKYQEELLNYYNMQKNKFNITDSIANVAEAQGDWRKKQNNIIHNYEKIQGIVIDTRYLLRNYLGDHLKDKKALINEIENKTAYKCIFGKGEDFNEDYYVTYQNEENIVFLKDYINGEKAVKENVARKKKNEDVLSFEENKLEMIKLIKETQIALENGDIETKDALKIQADLRTKLNSQFNVSDDSNGQYIVVNQKFNDICPYCGREVSAKIISKEEAKLIYNLKEDINE